MKLRATLRGTTRSLCALIRPAAADRPDDDGMSDPGDSFTLLLSAWNRGDRAARDRLMRLVYDELHAVAGSYLRRERFDHTLQATALVNEAYLRLAGGVRIEWRDRAHFFRAAAQAMRRILVDHARGLKAAKRGHGRKLSLDETRLITPSRDLDLLDLDRALETLSQFDERQSKLVELRFFAGLTVEEAADVLELSTATVKREWRTAKAWLRRELAQGRRTSGA